MHHNSCQVTGSGTPEISPVHPVLWQYFPGFVAFGVSINNNRFSFVYLQSYNTNLLLTSLISKIALLPHKHVHEYLLNPYVPLRDGVTNLCTAFTEVSHGSVSKYCPGLWVCNSLTSNWHYQFWYSNCAGDQGGQECGEGEESPKWSAVTELM